MKITWKSFLVVTAVLICVVLALSHVDNAVLSQHQSGAKIRVHVVDLQGVDVHNAVVKILGTSVQFNTDNNGLSPLIELPTFTNVYDSTIDQWYTVNLQVQKQGYVDAFVLNCVVYMQQDRIVTVRVYPVDDSNLPYVCYVESPPDEYLHSLIAPK